MWVGRAAGGEASRKTPGREERERSGGGGGGKEESTVLNILRVGRWRVTWSKKEAAVGPP